jgi:hypothetical protein
MEKDQRSIDMGIKIRVVELPAAKGNIEPREDQLERFDEFVEDLKTGEFHKTTDKTIPCKCIDRRLCEQGLEGPNSAGGTLSLVVADDLTRKRFATEDGSIAGATAQIGNMLEACDQPIGVHTDTHARDDASGCGANDKLSEIYMNLGRYEDEIRRVGSLLTGTEFGNTTNDLIFNNALERSEFSTGSDVHAAATAGPSVFVVSG